LNEDGKALWRNVTREFDFNSAEMALLQQLCETIDEIAAMKAEMSDMGVVVAGSKGQPVVNPVIKTLAEHRKLADQLTAALALPVTGEVIGQRRSAAAKQAAQPGPRKSKSRGRLAALDHQLRPARTIERI
jgi:P27 family predicted phage terminase small subunit